VPSTEIHLGIQVLRFTPVGVEQFADEVAQTVITVETVHGRQLGALRVDGVIAQVGTEDLHRILDTHDGEVVALLRRIQRGVACVFAVNGKTVTCLVREARYDGTSNPVALWRAQPAGQAGYVEVVGVGKLEREEHIAGLRRAVTAALEAQAAI
jgi:hypothetical protein